MQQPVMHPPMMGKGPPGPRRRQFMEPLPLLPNTPPGLQYLATVDHLFVRQMLEPFEILTGIETENAYEIYANGYMLYWAQERSDCCERYCCGPNRTFEMTVTDGTGAHVMRFFRPLNITCCCCCLQEMTVEAPMGNLVGKVEQLFNLCGADFLVKNALGQPIMKITGPCCMCCEVDFQVMDMRGVQVGQVTKHFTGIQELFSDADNFGISFPRTLPVESKALLLGACVLIDFIYFENKQNNRHY